MSPSCVNPKIINGRLESPDTHQVALEAPGIVVAIHEEECADRVSRQLPGGFLACDQSFVDVGIVYLCLWYCLWG